MKTLVRSEDVFLEALDAHDGHLVKALESLWDVRPNHFAPTRVSYACEGDDIVAIDFKWTRLTNETLRHLNHLTCLKQLSIHGAEITDAGMTELIPLQNLEELNLGRTQITDAGMDDLKQLPKLRRLDVSTTEVTDVGLTHIAEFNNLEDCYLNFCREVSDWGLAPLLDIPKLKLLHVHGTRVTSAGAEDFAAARPDCAVIR
ncbi:Leucine Rich repeats (2 copies) [Symmachiella macrocystis]|uniref:Leucine Rich repeats (2 copies) n=1 Tax=Symmachiella macrocystis TaxID=2527985 RepID=A0A5C6B5I0_9PLAN|nr:leucine-rich repeat domain-containing protein [Symmachiella macrocystis]TWU07198.1 Leucine Rich repeats (2 copies) [Symmachiella macrocystis]